MAADLMLFYMHINWPLSLSCKKFKIIFTLKRGDKDNLYMYTKEY